MFSWIKRKKKKFKITEDEAMRQEWERLQKRGKKKYVWVEYVNNIEDIGSFHRS